jgi:predicted O-linked N-acetylglucosamine transferase (SPINDLY family)
MSDIEAAKRLFFEALSFLDARDYLGAELRLREALTFTPHSISVLANLAVALAQQDKVEEALVFAARTTDIDARNVEALLVMANGYARQKQYREALATCDRIIAIEPTLAEVHGDRAVALNGLDRHEEALESCDRAIALQPSSATAHTNRGNTLAHLGRDVDALHAYDGALRLKPDLPEALAGRGHVLARRKRNQDALAAFARAIELDPNLAAGWTGRGNVLMHLKQFDEALSAYRRATACRPEPASGWLGCGNVLGQLQRVDEALDAYARALALRPDFPEVLMERASVYVQLNRYEDAFADLEKAFTKKPTLKFLEGERLHAKMHLCNWQNFDAECAALRASIASGGPASTPFPALAMPSSPEVQRRCSETYVAEIGIESPEPLWRGRSRPHDRIRVAYLSPDFREHVMMRLAADLFDRHDRSEFEITAISFGPDDGSETRQRVARSFDRFVDVRSRSDREAAEVIRDLAIDIAVDFCGYTRHFRPNILAHRPAPLQASYLGYPGTMGAHHIDYLVADRTLVPSEHRALYSERIVYLPDSYQVNSVRKMSEAVPSRAELGLPASGFVFCCFNNSFKITPDIFDIWMSLLREIEGSVLWLLAGPPGASANLRREADARGVAENRLVFAPRLAVDLHLARHRRADLFLDTFHYGAHTTASDALWTGLPVVTCCGSTFAGRVGASLLHAVGMDELIASSPDDYRKLAHELARNPAKLTATREKLNLRRESSPLFDTSRFTRHLELAYRTMWDRFRSGEPPEDLSICAIDS